MGGNAPDGSKKIRVLIVDDVEETRRNIERLLLLEDDIDVAGHAGSGEEAVQKAGQLLPDVILMDINMPGMNGIEAAQAITERLPGLSVVMISVQGELEYLKRAMAAGARDYLIKPFSSDELVQTVRRAFRFKEQTCSPAVAKENRLRERRPGFSVAVFSPKGGVGKTLIAANLALALAQKHSCRVIIVDLALASGDACTLYNVRPSLSMGELVVEMGTRRLDEAVLDKFICRGPYGVDLLAAPLRAEYAETVEEGHVKEVLKVLRGLYDYIIIDTAAGYGEVNLAAFDAARLILLVTTLDIPAIKNTKTALDVLGSLGHLAKTRVVVNRLGEEYGLRPEDVEKTLNTPVLAKLPADIKTAASSVNYGLPLYQSAPGTRLAAAVGELARMVAGEASLAKEPSTAGP